MALDAEELEDNLSMFDDWSERYQYIIDLGKKLEPYPEEVRDEAHKVRGCMSQVWLTHQVEGGANGPVLHFLGDSDSAIVRGLIAVLFALYSDQPPKAILEADLEGFFARVGLEQHLSPNRRNGFFSMVETIKKTAQAAS
jgi:cysteine desulfuration protein SufE